MLVMSKHVLNTRDRTGEAKKNRSTVTTGDAPAHSRFLKGQHMHKKDIGDKGRQIVIATRYSYVHCKLTKKTKFLATG